MRFSSTVLALFLLPSLAAAQQPSQGNLPSNGFVPDSATAVRIALAVWAPIYGDDIQSVPQHPCNATLQGGVWTVTKQMAHPDHPGQILLIAGSNTLSASGQVDTEVLKIDKRDGRILYQGRS